jgi:GT2 family glycosyltransferase
MTPTATQTAPRPFVRVVVVNFDGGEVTRRCVDALLATRYPSDRLEVVVVDNASVDGFNWVLREQYPQVRLIQSDTNEGFARGCNLAMRDLDGVDHVALINNDAIVDPDWLEPLLVPMADPTVGAVVPKLLLNVWAHAVTLRTDRLQRDPDDRLVGVKVERVEIDGVDRTDGVRFDERFWPADEGEHGQWTKGLASVWWPATDEPLDVRLTVSALGDAVVQVGLPGEPVAHAVGGEPSVIECRPAQRVRIINSAGGGLFKGWFGGDRGFMEPDLGQYDEPAEVFAWCGGAVLLRTAYLRDVGLFDPTFFLYYEDFDLSWRGRSSGWTYRYEPTSVVFHEHAYSSKAGSAFFQFWVDRNRRLTLVKNAPAGVAVRACLGAVKTAASDFARHTYHQARRLRPPSPGVTKEIVKPMVSVAAALPAALRERRRLARRRTVSHADIARWTISK